MVGQNRMRLLLAMLAGIGAMSIGSAVQAASIIVDTIADSGPGSLRAAIAQANATAGDDTIVFTTPISSPPIFFNLDSPLPELSSNITITGPGASAAIVQRNPLIPTGEFPIFVISGSPVVTISGLTISDGKSGFGGGVLIQGAPTVTIRNCVLSKNTTSGRGGAIAAAGSGDMSLSLIETLIDGNSADVAGAGVYLERTAGRVTVLIRRSTLSRNTTMAAVPDRTGGAFALVGAGPHTVTIDSSSITENAVAANGIGGGLYIESGGGTTTIVNSTIAGNSAGLGGAMSVRSSTVSITSSTLFANNSQRSGVGVLDLNSIVPTIKNTILSGNITSGQPRDLADGQAIIGNHNLIGIGGSLVNGVNGNIVGVSNPRLVPMNTNGGPTLTYSLTPESAALDAGSNTDAPAVDQRGQPRPADGDFNGTAVADIGAFETQMYAVTSAADIGPNTLRQAIINNNAAGGGFIKFAIAPAGQVSIPLQTALPPLSRITFIDGWSQGGGTYRGPPLVEINGASVNGGIGLDIVFSDCIVRGMAVNSFSSVTALGIGMRISTNRGTRTWIYGNYIGLGLDGVTDRGNGQAGLWIAPDAIQNLIGTNADGVLDAEERNVISGSRSSGVRSGVYIESNGNSIAGNYIGTNASGTGAVANYEGVWIARGSSNRIGPNGLFPGANGAIQRNVVSGNVNFGVTLTSSGTDNVISGNYIGLNAAGTGAVPNLMGILVDNVARTLIGGAFDVARNVVSGNLQDGINIAGSSSVESRIQGNYVGLNAAGTGAVPNGRVGIRIRQGARSTRIGTNGDNSFNESLRRNVISGNAARGIVIVDAATSDTRVFGNYIGLAADGTTPIGNMNAGVACVDSPGNIIGGLSTARNIIGGQTSAVNGHGVEVLGASAIGNRILSNLIGVTATGVAVGNAGSGVLIGTGATSTVVGGLNPAEANVIAFNGLNGVRVTDDASLANSILGNSIYANAALGIDLRGDGVTANGPALQVRVGPNALTNYPTITNVRNDGTITYTLAAAQGNTSYRIEFFASDTADPTGFGEGLTFLGSTTAITDSAGLAGPSQASVILPVGQVFITATATELTGAGAIIRGTATPPGTPLGTSEFSQARRVNSAPTVAAVSATGLEDTDVVVTLNASDPDPDTTLVLSIRTLPANGELLQFGTLTPITAVDTVVTDASQRVVLRPTANAFGNPFTAFTYRVTDGQLTSAIATATVFVTPVNDAPSFVASNPPAVNQNAPPVTILNWATFNPGPTNESDQTALAYVVSNVTNPGLFVTQPSISTNGTLTYTLAPNVNGASQFTVRVRDSGGTANGGVDTSPAQTFGITVQAVNQPPSFLAANPPTVLEDSGLARVTGWAQFTPGPASSDAGQTVLEYQISNVTNTSLFSTLPSVSPAGELTFRPAPDQFGTAQFTVRVRDTGGTANGGIDVSPTQTFLITVLPVNDAPSFVASNPPTVDQNAPVVTIPAWALFVPGPANEGDQAVLTYVVDGITNPQLFSVQPSVNQLGTLTYTLAANRNGTSQFNVRVRDNGGTANGGLDTSAVSTFTITVRAVNQPPSFAATNPPAVLEDSGLAVVSGWATFSPGPASSDSGQTVLAYDVSGLTNASLFSVAPTVSLSGVLSYVPAPNQFGSAQITVRVRDSGGTSNGGTDISSPQVFTIEVIPVNDAPSFVAIDPPVSLRNAGSQSVGNWATFSAGPSNESDQTISAYLVSNVTNPSLFSAAPSISAGGVLTYTAAPNAFGTSQFTVRVRDSGGTTNAGVDTSSAQTFTITVLNVNQKPSFVASDPPAVLESTSAVTINTWVSSFIPGPPSEADQTAIEYIVDQVSNPALFDELPRVTPLGRLTYIPAPSGFGVSTFRVRVRDSGGTANGGIDTSDPQTFRVIVRPAARCADVVIDLRRACSARTVTGSQLNRTPTEAGPGATQTVTFSRSLTQDFAIGRTPVTVTVQYSDGLQSSCIANVTVLAGDCNNNGIPDTCDIASGLVPDCNGDGIPDDCQCLWDNGNFPASSANQANGQLSHLGGGAPGGAKAADDLYFPPGSMYRITTFSGQVLTNSFAALRKARLEFYEDCNGSPADQPFITFSNSQVRSTTPAYDGFDLVTYAFDLCAQNLFLEGGRTYWVSLVGQTDAQGTDLSYWIATTASPNPSGTRGLQPAVRFGEPSSIPNQYNLGVWAPADSCCVGCVNLSWKVTGEACKIAWNNGPADLNVSTRGGSSSAGTTIRNRTADNFVLTPCESVEVCYLETSIWTNCNPVLGFAEIYSNDCAIPSGQPLLTGVATRVVPLGASIVVSGQTLQGYRLVFTNLNWRLDGGRTYWLSSGASNAGSLNTKSLFAFAQASCAAADCTNNRLSPGQFNDPLVTNGLWLETGRDFAFRLAIRTADGLSTPVGPGGQPLCAADANQDGTLDTADIFEFLTLWFAGCP